MFTLKVEDGAYEVDQNDRGRWSVLDYCADRGNITIEGFGGENLINVHYMGMSDGSMDIIVIHGCVDNPHIVVQETVKTGFFNQEAELAAFNKLIAQVCNYPEYL